MNNNKINFLIIVMCTDYRVNKIKLTREEYDTIQKECEFYEEKRAVSIEALKIIQKNRRWISDDAIALVAQVLSISVADIEEVATFYNQIFRQPVGRHVVRYCDSAVCFITGCQSIQKTLECMLNINIGNTTADNRFTLLPACCMGICDQAPVVTINEDVYTRIVPEQLNQVLGLYQ